MVVVGVGRMVGGGRKGYKGINGNGKNTIKNKMMWKIFGKLQK